MTGANCDRCGYMNCECRNRPLPTCMVPRFKKADDDKSRPDTSLGEIVNLLKTATDDEIGIVLMLARKLMGEGRREYGPLNIKTDTRTVGDIVRDSCDEMVDSLFYMFLAQSKIEADENAKGKV